MRVKGGIDVDPKNQPSPAHYLCALRLKEWGLAPILGWAIFPEMLRNLLGKLIFDHTEEIPFPVEAIYDLQAKSDVFLLTEK